jgi:mannose-6-phosphate isomerase-like protein (cupin superfamily)
MQKSDKFRLIREHIIDLGFRIINEDITRPWGGFFVIDESQSKDFIHQYFPGTQESSNKVSPKFLLVEPSKKLSWQYHHRRSEKWKVIEGRVGVSTSMTDNENPPQILQEQEIIILKQGERHRLIGLDDWAVIAEIWIHTDPQNPSDEEDIVRLQDDFGR